MRFLFSALTLLVIEQLALADLSKEAMVQENGLDRETRVLIQDNYYTLVSKLEHQETEIATLKTQQTNKQTELDQLKAEVAVLKTNQATKLPRVAFKALLAKQTSLAENQLIVFDDIRFNVGLAYHHGTFIAPYDGTYLFSVSMCSVGGHYIVVDLLRNGNMIGQVLAGENTSFVACASETTVTELSAGDDVVVQHQGTQGDYLYGSQTVHSSFTGVLLY